MEDAMQTARTSTGMRSLADVRPNMYIPSSDPLELPKPYLSGSLSPFKPSAMGSNMRYYRKSVQEISL